MVLICVLSRMFELNLVYSINLSMSSFTENKIVNIVPITCYYIHYIFVRLYPCIKLCETISNIDMHANTNIDKEIEKIWGPD